MNIPIVGVLMSTYNGEKYIQEQLDSIFDQKDVDVRLFVRDDGSSDATLDILSEYAERFCVKILKDGTNVGPGESFMRLVYEYAHEPDLNYFAFADQDDIWLDNKLITAINSISNSGFEGPVLYCSNQYIYEDGKINGERYTEKQSIELIPHMTLNTISGCTFVFNKELAFLVADADKPESRIIKYRLHDSWIMLVAIVCGHVIYDESSHMLYRIHSENVVGVKKDSFKEKYHKLQRMFNKSSSNLRMVTAQEILRLYPVKDQKDKRILLLFSDYKKNVRNKKILIKDKEIIEGCQENTMIFKLKILFGLV